MSPEPDATTHLQRRIEALHVLQSLAQDLTAELDLDRLLAKTLRGAVLVVGATAGSLLLHDPSPDELVFEVIEGGGGPALKGMRIHSDQGIAGSTFTSRKPIIVDDVDLDVRFLKGLDRNYGYRTRSLLAVPLIAKGAAIGVLEVMNKATDEAFTSEDQELMLAFASQSAIAIENARLYRQVVQERDRILQVEAGVRHELARDLHDGPAQMISSIIMGVRFLRDLVQRQPERALGELVQLEALAEKALYQVRNLLFDLRPLILETQGLKPAFDTYAERLRLLEPFSIRVETEGLVTRWSAKAESAIFSIVQEAVNNAKKHGSPRRLLIRAVQNETQAVITVQDDGRGFDLDKVEASYGARGSLGLLNMKERAEIAHARLAVDSIPGQGTTVTLVVPLPREQVPQESHPDTP